MTPLSTMKILSEIQHQLYALTVVVILQFVTLILVACFIATRLRSLVVPITQKASPVAARRSSQRGSDQFGTPRSRSSTHNYGGEKDEALTLALSLTDIKNAEERILNEDVCSQWQSLEVTRQRRPNSETKL